MKKLVLDTNVLIRFWRQSRSKPPARNTARQARAWAERLVELHETDAIVTPIYIEMVAGTRNRHDLELTRAYLSRFRCIDEGKIIPRDWEEAARMAQRVPKGGKPRDLGDCLIRAIADRLNHTVLTFDEGFPG
jgi:predicted nucleic acid-binding protein